MLRYFLEETKRFFKMFIPLTIIVFIPIYIKRNLDISQGLEIFIVSLLKGYLVYMLYIVVKELLDRFRNRQ